MVGIGESGELKVRYSTENLLCNICAEAVVKVGTQPSLYTFESSSWWSKLAVGAKVKGTATLAAYATRAFCPRAFVLCTM